MKYLIFGSVYGVLYKNPLYDEYKRKIQEDLELSEPFENEDDVIETLKLSLENGKTFYENAKPYMKKQMEDIENNIENGVRY